MEANTRSYRGYNLNRLFTEEYLNSGSKEYAIQRAIDLSEIMDEADYLLDIHSTSGPTVPFIFSENRERNLEIVSNLGIPHVIIGWNEVAGDVLAGDTETYMNSLGKPGFTLEAGSHLDSGAADIAYEVLHNYLAHLKIIKKKTRKDPPSIQKVSMYKVITTASGVFQFEKKFPNFHPIQKGDLIGYEGKEKNPLLAEEDFIMLLPNM